MFASIAEGTVKQYNSVLKYWWSFCTENSQDPFIASDTTILKCLTKGFAEGANYGTLNSLRPVIALINSLNTSESPLITRFFRGVFKLRPTISKYQSTWNVDIMLKKLKEWSPSKSLELSRLTIKLTMLLALGSAFRAQSLSLIKLKDIRIHPGGVNIQITNLIKTSKFGVNQPQTFLPFFSDEDICLAHTLLSYMEATKSIKGEKDRLLLSFKKLYNEIGSQTVSR